MLTAIQMEGEISEELMNQVFHGAWASNVPGRVKNAPPIVIKLKERKQPIIIKQYPLTRNGGQGRNYPNSEKLFAIRIVKRMSI